MTQGHLFVLEGPDGVGKSSIIRGVAERLRSLAIGHSMLSFPGREPGSLGNLIYEIHHDPKGFGIEGMSEAAKQALHIAAHLDSIERWIRPTLERGTHILLDRFWWSTWVYGVIGGVSTHVLEALIEAERAQWAIKPSLVVLLDRDAPIERDDEDPVCWNRLRAEYLALASKESARYPVEVVENTGSLDQAVKFVEKRVLSCGS